MIIKNAIISPINQHLPSQLLTQENDSRQLHVPDVVAVSWRFGLADRKMPHSATTVSGQTTTSPKPDLRFRRGAGTPTVLKYLFEMPSFIPLDEGRSTETSHSLKPPASHKKNICEYMIICGYQKKTSYPLVIILW